MALFDCKIQATSGHARALSRSRSWPAVTPFTVALVPTGMNMGV